MVSSINAASSSALDAPSLATSCAASPSRSSTPAARAQPHAGSGPRCQRRRGRYPAGEAEDQARTGCRGSCRRAAPRSRPGGQELVGRQQLHPAHPYAPSAREFPAELVRCRWRHWPDRSSRASRPWLRCHSIRVPHWVRKSSVRGRIPMSDISVTLVFVSAFDLVAGPLPHQPHQRRATRPAPHLEEAGRLELEHGPGMRPPAAKT
jgi:hypothetical protein